MTIIEIVGLLKQERDRLSGAIAALEGHPVGNGRRGRPQGTKTKATAGPATSFPFGKLKPKRGKRRLSAAAKKRISARMKARWAKAKKSGKNSLG